MRRIALAALLSLAAALPAAATTISYPDFSSTAGLTLNGDAAAVNDGSRTVLRLTPAAVGQAGSAFSTTPVTLGAAASFSTAFTFNINAADGAGGGADGIVFVVQTVANNVGGGGGGIGYEGIPNSVGVKFDTFRNGGDISDNFIGLVSGGQIIATQAVQAPFTLKNGGDLFAFIDYDGATNLLQVRLNDTALRPTLPTLAATIDVAAALGSTSAFVGFTSGTGAGYANHDVASLEFRDSFNPIDPANPTPVPEPATAALLGAGLLVPGLRRRRRA